MFQYNSGSPQDPDAEYSHINALKMINDECSGVKLWYFQCGCILLHELQININVVFCN